MAEDTFRGALRDLQARRYGAKGLQTGYVPTVREWLGATVLDHLGLTPTALLDGVTLLRCGHVDVELSVADLLRRLYRGMLLSRGSSESPHDGGLTLLQGSMGVDDYDDAANVGAPVVALMTSVDVLRPVEVGLHPTRIGEVEIPLPADVVADWVECVTGGRLDLAEADAVRLSPTDLLRAVHRGSPLAECARRIRAALDALDAEEAEADGTVRAEPVARKPAAGGAAPAYPVPLAAAAQGVVRRLSEMTGFGEAAQWGINLAADLRDYRAGTLPWGDVDRGLLLSGPPGSGKTTFAKALALECGVELVTTTYNEWSSQGGNVSDVMSRGLTKLFEAWRTKAKKEGAIILFVDEIDSMAARGTSGHNDGWYAPIVNAWLAFLDGAVPRDGIVVVGATNHPGHVDPALLRPGRLDRHLELPTPDLAAMVGIVRAHLGADAVIDEAELAEAARAVRGRSPAEISLLAREARRVARWCKRRVCANDLTAVLAVRRLASGVTARTDHDTAVHEAAHAVAAVALDVDKLESVDLDGAKTSFLADAHWTAAVAERRLTVLLAARAAEEVLLLGPSTGAQQDLRDATALATGMHAAWGWGAAGLVALPPAEALVDPDVRAAVRDTLDAAYGRALALVRREREAIVRVADALVRRRHLDAAEVRALVDGPPAPAPRGPRVRVVGDPRRIPPGI